MNSLFDNTIQLLTKAVSYNLKRHNVIASNIANVDTPGYKAMDLKFEHLFKDTLAGISKRGSATALSTKRGSATALSTKRGSATALSTKPEGKNSEPMMILDTTGRPRLDGNTVNPDLQMAKLVENTITHNSLVQLLNTKFKMLQTAIS